MRKREKAVLVLETGECYQGFACGSPGEAVGEVVFNTSMTGYQEILTDPSYGGQLVTMTYPHIGNYGINPGDNESRGAQPSGFILRELSWFSSNYRYSQSLEEYLTANDVTTIEGLDTRALTRRIREGGAAMGIIAHGCVPSDRDALVDKLSQSPRYEEIDYVAKASVKEPTCVVGEEDGGDDFAPMKLQFRDLVESPSASGKHVIVIDYGVKFSILRNLLKLGYRVTLVPSSSSAEAVLSLCPDGVLLSNGPGDPARLTCEVAEIKSLLGKVPVGGICLGHQLLSLALGATTFKLKYGHRGANQPVSDLRTGRVEITSQNHGYAVDGASLREGVVVTHLNLNDNTVEGIVDNSIRAMSVQYHPEAGPGPNDANGFFQEFKGLLG